MSKYYDLPKEALASMLKHCATDREATEAFFNNFLYVKHLFSGNYSMALDQGIELLDTLQGIDNDAYRQVHKGTPYYWLGTAAFLMHDYQTAIFFYDAALSEDIRAGARADKNPTPAMHFILLEGEKLKQAAKSLVQDSQARLQAQIQIYNGSPGRPKDVQDLTVENLREYFLRLAISPDRENWSTLSTSLISFLLEWNYRNTLLDLRVSQGTSEPFFTHLFKGCVLFESLLRSNPVIIPQGNNLTLIKYLQASRVELNIPNDIPIGNADLPTIMNDLETVDDDVRLETAVQFTGKLRNSLGHNLGWPTTLNKKLYQQLFQMVFSSCLHVLACLYIPRIP